MKNLFLCGTVSLSAEARKIGAIAGSTDAKARSQKGELRNEKRGLWDANEVKDAYFPFQFPFAVLLVLDGGGIKQSQESSRQIEIKRSEDLRLLGSCCLLKHLFTSLQLEFSRTNLHQNSSINSESSFLNGARV